MFDTDFSLPSEFRLPTRSSPLIANSPRSSSPQMLCQMRLQRIPSQASAIQSPTRISCGRPVWFRRWDRSRHWTSSRRPRHRRCCLLLDHRPPRLFHRRCRRRLARPSAPYHVFTFAIGAASHFAHRTHSFCFARISLPLPEQAGVVRPSADISKLASIFWATMDGCEKDQWKEKAVLAKRSLAVMRAEHPELCTKKRAKRGSLASRRRGVAGDKNVGLSSREWDSTRIADVGSSFPSQTRRRPWLSLRRIPMRSYFQTPSQPIFSDATSFGLLPSNVPMLPITPLESTRPEPYLNDVWNPLSLSTSNPVLSKHRRLGLHMSR